METNPTHSMFIFWCQKKDISSIYHKNKLWILECKLVRSRIFRDNLRSNSLLKVGEHTQNKIISQNIFFLQIENMVYAQSTQKLSFYSQLIKYYSVNESYFA